MQKLFFTLHVAYNDALNGLQFSTFLRPTDEQMNYNGEIPLGGIFAEVVPQETEISISSQDDQLVNEGDVFYGPKGLKYRRIGTETWQ